MLGMFRVTFFFSSLLTYLNFIRLHKSLSRLTKKNSRVIV
jgi:hypothetical protein